MVGGLVGFWCIRPWLGTNAFNFGQIAVLVATRKIASLLCLPRNAWARFTPLRFLAYCVWCGMQPRQFLVGQRTALGAPIPTWAGWFLNAVTGAVLLWLVPRLLPVGTPWAIRFWIALVGLCFLRMFALGTSISMRQTVFRARWASQSRKALGLPGRREIARRFLGKALEPHRSGVLAGSDLPSRCAPRWRQDRTLGRFWLQRTVPRIRQLHGKLGIWQAVSVLHGAMPWCRDREYAADAPPAPRPHLAGTCVDVRCRCPARRPVRSSGLRRPISRADAGGPRRAGAGALPEIGPCLQSRPARVGHAEIPDEVTGRRRLGLRGPPPCTSRSLPLDCIGYDVPGTLGAADL